MITIQGKGVSAGVGVGPLYFYRRATAEIKRYTVEDTDAEWHRFKGAQTGAIEQLGVLAEQARKEAGDEAAMLFETHQMMAEDLDFEEAIEDRIVNQKMNAEAAVSDTSEQFAEMFASMDDAYMQARAADVKDVSQRILGILCGIVQGGIASDVPVLLCADDLAPSETIQLDKSKVLGFITAGGSGSSHTAILARTLGIPAIVGMGDALKPELEGRAAIADGSTGALVIDPDDDTRDRLLKKRDEQLRLQRLLETLKGQANVTKDGKTIRIMTSAQDHKRAKDGDQGLNTGGMGTFSPSPFYTEEVDAFCKKYIYQATVDAMAAEGRPFKGVIFFGLMLTPNGPKVLEYNARFGDPEAQVVLPRMKNDIIEVMEACVDGTLDQIDLQFEDNAAVCVVLASDGYPVSYEKGFVISGLENFDGKDGYYCFHAGTKLTDKGIVTNGGRVLGVTAKGADLKEARANAYAATEWISFENKYMRHDIGKAIDEA